MREYNACSLCMRRCGINRYEKIGYCKMDAKMRVCRIAPHPWEEPIISGTRGSGTVFFSGCSLGCIFCQNSKISRTPVGREISEEELSSELLSLASLGVHNINFVTPTHFAPSVIKTVALSREAGLSLPIVYNTGSYETKETVRSLSGTVDVYLPDLKYYLPKTAEAYSKAADYPTVARRAIAEMVEQVGAPVIEDGIIKRGVVVRILLLPSHLAEAKLSLKHLYESYGDSVYVSLMSQYTPILGIPKPLDRRVSRAEYRELCDYALTLGVKNAFVQDAESADAAYIPDFNTD